MKRDKFSLSNYKLATFGLGQLVPCGLTEVIPGDSFDHTASTLMRFSPMLAPVMHPVDIRVHHWFVPIRLLWDDFEDFITGGADGAQRPAVPTVFPTVEKYSLADYLGVPVDDTIAQEVSALPFRAYNKIYNEFYRDQDLVTPVTEDSNAVQRVAWQKDYFTSARPWTQKGPDITIPVTGSGVFPVTPTGATGTPPVGQAPVFTFAGDTRDFYIDGVNSDDMPYFNTGVNVTPRENMRWRDPKLEVDVGGTSNIGVLDLREAFALQRYAEARARYGSRYTEYLRYLGVRSSDARLQRPEYLGGGKQTVSISEVLQTAEGTNPVGAMRGHGISAMRSRSYRKFFEEHGYVVSLISVLPRVMYTENTPRHFLKRTREDYFQRELQHVGQQEIWKAEVYPSVNTDPDRFDAWGYQDRYAEYRHQYSSVAGDFRDTLNYWHMARSFSTAPVLNKSFIECNPGRRNFADQTSDQLLWTMVNHRIRARRMVSRNSAGRII